jgi:hypothetical protein
MSAEFTRKRRAGTGLSTLVEKGKRLCQILLWFLFCRRPCGVFKPFFDRWQTRRKRLQNKYHNKTVSITPPFSTRYSLHKIFQPPKKFNLFPPSYRRSCGGLALPWRHVIRLGSALIKFNNWRRATSRRVNVPLTVCHLAR